MPPGGEPDLPTLLRETGALLSGHFRLSSGLHSPNYVQCARLLEDPATASALGEALATRLRAVTPDRVVSPALGGVVIGFVVAQALGVPFSFTERKDGAMTLRRGFQLRAGERIAVVEDVVTTGKSTRETVNVIEQQGAKVVGYGSILNRSGRANPFGEAYEALLDLDLATFDESECPLCLAGAPLDAPGSRFSGAAGAR